VVLQLVDAILSCNRHGIAHRDIKLSNVTFPLKNKKLKEESPLKIKKSLSATFLPFQNVSQQYDILGNNNSKNNSNDNKNSKPRKGNNEITEIDITETESDFVFDYGEIEENSVKENSKMTENDSKISKNENETENETENESSDVLEESVDDNIYIKLADFGMAGFIGRDGRLRGRCGTPGKISRYTLSFNSFCVWRRVYVCVRVCVCVC
jgi:serine/threonine protein kinase